jgi:hypothetical protein
MINDCITTLLSSIMMLYSVDITMHNNTTKHLITQNMRKFPFAKHTNHTHATHQPASPSWLPLPNSAILGLRSQQWNPKSEARHRPDPKVIIFNIKP